MRIVDLYGILSRALWYNLDEKKLIDGDEAVRLFARRSEFKKLGTLSRDEGIRVDIFGGLIISGIIYQAC